MPNIVEASNGLVLTLDIPRERCKEDVPAKRQAIMDAIHAQFPEAQQILSSNAPRMNIAGVTEEALLSIQALLEGRKDEFGVVDMYRNQRQVIREYC